MRETEDNNNNDIGQIRTRVVSEQASLLQALMAFWHAMRKTGGDNPKFRLLTFVDSIDSVWRITKNLDDAENNPRKQLFQFRIPRGRWDSAENIVGNNNCPKVRLEEACESPPHQFLKGVEFINKANVGGRWVIAPMNLGVQCELWAESVGTPRSLLSFPVMT